ncbi:FAD-binding domain-containing protein [Kineococcus rubinsiae]|uniref:FAD-binding domain-containing protein n=1 Tax=Kineococcus rubinsiae TaxID=2609562 RepID=UPI0014316E70|nr:FAD-binding domain-containing protein [Kineococcus rubinsiae]NIZ89986.1 deoxyribodipyrimidine photolyase [Kineococcus rubinsiae]
MPLLPPPPADRDDCVDWVRTHLGHLACDDVAASPVRGGQSAADTALATLDLTGYAAKRNEVLPRTRRGATRLSPYIRHGLLPLPAVWAAAADAPPRDRAKFRDELLWQEYARHLYARVGAANAQPLRFEAPVPATPWTREPWPEEMACMAATTQELHEDGWLVNQTRMWLASQYSVRAGGDWREGAVEMYRHLLDGSAAANRLGWQWAVGTGTGKVYGFSRWQVEKRAPGLCRSCALRTACPVQEWPDAETGPRVEPPAGLAGGPSGPGGDLQGPATVETTGEPDTVWLTAESLGDTDPALLAHPDLPAVFVLDEPLLARLRLSGKRLVFLSETLAELGVEVRRGDPVEELRGRRLAVTHAPVPGFARRARSLDVVETHPWPWLRRPGSGSLRSFSAWAR